MKKVGSRAFFAISGAASHTPAAHKGVEHDGFVYAASDFKVVFGRPNERD
jgi:hypothetical protein